MDDLIYCVNRLQDALVSSGGLSDKDIQLPQIVVIGMQSSGKSSVLESLVGESFLPRGEGTVTRTPIILQLKQHKKQHGDTGPEKWCEFFHRQGQKFVDFNEVEKEIREYTNVLAGPSGIVNKPIRVTVYSPNVVNLTLVDLPGIIRIPFGGLPDDIEHQIRTMLREYTTNPNSIILAVTPANNDLPTSDSLQMAREVDPDGHKTLAVLTKLDLMDQGSAYAQNVLSGKVIPVKLGIIGVINRSQQDNANRKTVEQALIDEDQFLKQHFPKMASKNGTKYLAKRLSEILKTHIYKCLPNLERRLIEIRTKTQKEFDSLGVIDLPSDKSLTVLEVIKKFCDAFGAEIYGKTRNMDITRMYSSQRMSYVFTETFAQSLQSIDPLQDITDEHIRNAILGSRGLESDLFLPEDAFHHLVRYQIRRMEAPALHCADLVDTVMMEAIDNALNSDQVSSYTMRFPILGAAITGITQNLLAERMKIAKEKISDHIDILASFIKTCDQEFRNSQTELTRGIDINKPDVDPEQLLNGPSDPIAVSTETFHTAETDGVEPEPGPSTTVETVEQPAAEAGNPFEPTVEVKTNAEEKKPNSEPQGNAHKFDVVRKLVEKYFMLERKDVQNYVPRSLVQTVIYYTQDNIHTLLSHQLHNPIKAEELVQAPEGFNEERESLEGSLLKLEDSLKYIRECRVSYSG